MLSTIRVVDETSCPYSKVYDLMESNWNNLVKFCICAYNRTYPQLAYIIEILS